MPSLVANYKEKVLVTQVKHAYSDLQNALKMYAYENNCADITCISDTSANTETSTKRLAEMFKGAKFCSSSDNTGMCQKTMYKAAVKINNGTGKTGYGDNINPPFFISSSGAVYQVVQYSECVRIGTGNVRDENGNYILDENGKYKTQVTTTDVCARIYMDVNGTKKGPNQAGGDFYALIISSDSVNPDPNYYLKQVLSKGKLQYTPYNVGDNF